jgi:hypothetical protein
MTSRSVVSPFDIIRDVLNTYKTSCPAAKVFISLLPATMASTCTYQFDTAVYKGAVTFPTQLFINGEFVDPVNKGTIE